MTTNQRRSGTAAGVVVGSLHFMMMMTLDWQFGGR